MAPRTANGRYSEGKLQLILRHAAQIFAAQGYASTSIRDISRATGLPLSSLYYYFERKQKLLYLIQIHAFTSILDELERRWNVTTEPLQCLTVFIPNHMLYLLTHPAER